MDDQRSAFGDCHPITVPPDPRRLTIGPFMLEICSLVARSVWVVPETDRHTGHRLQDHHLAHFSDQGAAIRRGDLIHRFHYLVDVRRTHADSVAVQRGIATPVDDQRSAFGDCHPITVPPDPRRLTIGPFVLEICSLVARSVWVVPEADRHTGHRLQDHHLAHFSDQGAAIRRPAVQIDTQVAGGQLTRMGGHFRRTAGEGGTDIGTPRQRRNCGPGMRTRPLEKIRRER
ncbi:Uncharacterised protein [Mycobacteroides abscessus subsp. abscessus]|nr:Uncharacterised protein [Mycobacteroides abscessus subsp. abscessus]